MEIIGMESQVEYAVLLVLVSVVVGMCAKRWRRSIRYPPSPVALPIIGHMHLLGALSHISLQNLASKYGPFMSIRVGGQVQYVVSDGATAREVFRTHDIKFAARPEFISADHDIYNGAVLSGMDYGKCWSFLKKMCVTELLSAQQVRKFSIIRKEERVNLLRAFMNKFEQGEACDVGLQLLVMANNLISRMTTSTRCSGSDSEGTKVKEIAVGVSLLNDAIGLGASFPLIRKYDLLGTGKKLKDLLLKFDALMETIILQHEKESQNGNDGMEDMTTILLRVSEDELAETRITKREIKGLFLDLFMGGTDATSISIQWALAQLLNHPSALKKLQQEIDNAVGLSKLVDESDIPNLPYLQAVVKESLRLHPSLPLIIRRCREECAIKGYPIPKDSLVMLNLYAINRDSDFWENSTDFVPERFMGDDAKGQNVNYVPFGGGRRSCPGTGLALVVLQITLAAMIQCFDWKLKGAEKVNMEERPGFSVSMAHPLICYPKLRVNPQLLTHVN